MELKPFRAIVEAESWYEFVPLVKAHSDVMSVAAFGDVFSLVVRLLFCNAQLSSEPNRQIYTESTEKGLRPPLMECTLAMESDYLDFGVDCMYCGWHMTSQVVSMNFFSSTKCRQTDDILAWYYDIVSHGMHKQLAAMLTLEQSLKILPQSSHSPLAKS